MLSRLKNLVIPPQVKLVAALAVVIAAFFAGVEWRDRSADLELSDLQSQYDQAQLEANKLADAHEAAMQSAADAVAAEAAAKKAAAEARAQVVTKEVIRYVTKNTSAGSCTLPDEWVRIHDDSTSDEVRGEAKPTGSANDTPRTLTDIDALPVITGNYAICLDTARRLRALQAHVREVR